MKDEAQASNPIEECANQVAAQAEADVILYNGPILRPTDSRFIHTCTNRHRHRNAFLILVTTGGDPNAAYRIARCLQANYEHFALYVSGYCKSAGTIIALGAHELIVSDHGELGPLDVQMLKKDEIGETQSGLTVLDTLSALEDNAFAAFEKFFLQTKAKSNGLLTSRTAAKIATEMTTGLFSALYGQVDPLHIGEAGRAMSIAGHYGQRLLQKSRNIHRSALNSIMSDYPSHGFVIDRAEAASLFENVRAPTPDEAALAQALGEMALFPDGISGDTHLPFSFLSAELQRETSTAKHTQSTGDADERPNAIQGAEPVNTAGTSSQELTERHGEEEPLSEAPAVQ